MGMVEVEDTHPREQRIIRVQEIVVDILEKHEETRNDDRLLIYYFLVEQGVIDDSRAMMSLFKSIASFSTVLRARRKIQNDHHHMMPTDPEVLYIRAQQNEAMKAYALNSLYYGSIYSQGRNIIEGVPHSPTFTVLSRGKGIKEGDVYVTNIGIDNMKKPEGVEMETRGKDGSDGELETWQTVGTFLEGVLRNIRPSPKYPDSTSKILDLELEDATSKSCVGTTVIMDKIRLPEHCKEGEEDDIGRWIELKYLGTVSGSGNDYKNFDVKLSKGWKAPAPAES